VGLVASCRYLDAAFVHIVEGYKPITY